MDGAWHVALRDITIIMAAGALVSAVVMAVMVLWQLYRLARELRDELKPILDSLRETADTVRDTAGFMGGKVVTPAVSAFGAAAGARSLFSLLRQFYRNLQGADESKR